MHYLIENTEEAAFILSMGNAKRLYQKLNKLTKSTNSSLSVVDQTSFIKLYQFDEGYLTRKELT